MGKQPSTLIDRYVERAFTQVQTQSKHSTESMGTDERQQMSGEDNKSSRCASDYGARQKERSDDDRRQRVDNNGDMR